MTTQPTLVRRPADIDPTDWEHMSWHARLRAHKRAAASRPVIDDDGLRYHATGAEFLAAVETLITEGHTDIHAVAQRLNRTPSTVLTRLSHLGRGDLRRQLRGAR